MSGDVLSQAEVESLLSSMGASAAPESASGSQAGNAPRRGSRRHQEKVTVYDFKRPERVGKEQMRALQTLHEGFARSFAVALSALLRTMVEVKLTGADQLTYSEFIFSLENPTCFNLLRSEKLESDLILDINPSILYPVIDRLLGGGRESGPPARRPLTEIELRIVSRITRLFLDELHLAWENVVPLDLQVVRVESNPQLVQIVPPNEVVVLVSFELTVGDMRGMTNLCIPFNAIDRLGASLSANNWASYGKKTFTPETAEQVGRNLQGSLVKLVARLAETKISTSELIGLRVGDVITTEHDINTPLVLSIEGLDKFRARCGAYKGRKAVRIEESLTMSETPSAVRGDGEQGR